MNFNASTHEADTVADTLGGRLSRARESAGMTLPELARSVGVLPETLAAWENDRSEPRANRMVTIAGILGVSPAWLMAGMGEEPDDDRLPALQKDLLAEVERLKGIHEQSAAALSNIQALTARITAEQEAELSS